MFSSSMKKKSARRVLIVGNGSLFDEGLSHLLEDKAFLEVSYMTSGNHSDFLQYFREVRPEVVVLFQGNPLSVSRVFELLKDAPNVATLRVITVMVETNTIELYEKHQVANVGTNDLCSLIQQNVSDESSP